MSGARDPARRPYLDAALKGAAARARAVPGISLAAPAPRAAMRGRTRPSYRLTGWLLLGVVLLAPLPAGSNRPVAWMLWATLLYGLAAVLLARRALRPGAPPFLALRMPLVVGPPLVLLAWGAVQILPLGQLLPLALPDTGAARPSTISIAPDASALALLRMGASLVFFVLMLEAGARPSRARFLAAAIFTGVVLHAVWGMVALNLLGDVHFWGPKTSYPGAATGAFVNRNSFATFLGIGAVLGLSRILEDMRQPRIRRARGGALTSPETVRAALDWVALGLVLASLVMTQSRMGLFATTLALILVVVLSPHRPLSPAAGRPRRKWLAGLGLLAMTGLALLASGGVIERMLFLARATSGRLEIYRQTLGMILARPLSGHGADSFAPGFELYRRPALSPHLTFELPHSSYLTLWSDFGLVAGSLLVVAGGAALWRLWRYLGTRPPDAGLPVAALAATVLVAVHSLVDFSLEMQANLFLYLAVLALGLARRPAHPGPAA